MRSQVMFVMHPADEAEFVERIKAEPEVVFVDGPNWSRRSPPILADLQHADNYLMIWNPTETPPLKGERYRSEKGDWWCCENSYHTIQFLRSGFQFGEPFLFEGRIAIATTGKDGMYSDEATAPSVERRFKSLRRFLQKSYTNGVIIWQDLSAPRSKTDPLKPAKNLWVGPHALQWLRQDPTNRWVQQFRFGRVRGYILDLVGNPENRVR
jgi:hypothetical protein